MIQPNMATMLAFVAMNFELRAEQMKRALPGIAAATFNAVHVDTHTSTNDTRSWSSPAVAPQYS